MAINAEEHQITGEVRLFPQEGGWYYVAVPQAISQELHYLADRGLIAIRATLGVTSWNTSLMPMGDESHFVALNAKVRKANNIGVGDRVVVRFQTRKLR